MTTSLPAIDLFTGSEPARANTVRDRGQRRDGSPFALELEKAQPVTDRHAHDAAVADAASEKAADDRAQAAAHDLDATRAQNAKREQNADREHKVDREHEAERARAAHDAQNARDHADDDASTTQQTIVRADSAAAASSSEAPPDTAATSAPTDAVATAARAAQLAPPFGLDALLAATNPDAAPLAATADTKSADAAARQAGTTTDPAGAAASGAPAGEAGSPATGTAAAQQRGSARSPHDPAAQAAIDATATTDVDAVPAPTVDPTAEADTDARRDSDANATRSTATATAPLRDDSVRPRTADVDFSGLNDDTDVRALLAQHAAQQRRVASVAGVDRAFAGTESTRAGTQAVAAERAARSDDNDTNREPTRSPTAGEVGDAEPKTDPGPVNAATPPTAGARSTASAVQARPGAVPTQDPALGATAASTATASRAPAAPTASPPAATPHAVPIQAILAQVRHQVRGGAHAINLRLDPAELGRLTLRFRMEGDQLHVAVRATRPEVVEALRADLSAFADTLRDAGIDLTALDIDLAAPRDGDSNPAFSDLLGDTGSKAATNHDSDSTTAVANEPSRSRAHDGLVDVLA